MNTDSPIFVNQYLNIDFTVEDQDDVVVDITTAVMSFILRAKGNAKKVLIPYLIDGPAGQLRYTTNSSDLDVPGEYEAQAIITIDGKEYPTSIIEFNVLARI